MAKKTGKNKRAAGEGMIRERKKGQWEARLSIFDPTSNTTKRLSFYGKSQGEVKEKLDAAKADIRSGKFAMPHKDTFKAWLLKYLEVYKKPHIRPSSYANYDHIAQTHIIPEIGDIKLQALQTDDIQKLYNKKQEKGRVDGKGGLSPRILHLMHQVINSSLQQAVRNKLISYNPAEATTLPKLKYKEMSTLDREQVSKYLKAVRGERLQTAFILELATGLRRGELLGIRWSDINFEDRTLSIKRSLSRVRQQDKDSGKKSKLMFQNPKTEKGCREIPLLPAIIMELNAHKVRQEKEKEDAGKEAYKDEDLVFCTPIGTPMEPRNLHRIHVKILESAELPHVRFHDLRHSFATMMVEAGEEPKALQDILGHTKISTTYDLYVHASREMKSKALSSLSDLFTPKETKEEEGRKALHLKVVNGSRK